MRAIVYGGGSWGTALAHILARAGHQTALLLRDANLAAEINALHENTRYLPGLPLAPEVEAITDPALLAEANLWIMAVPCQSQRRVLEQVRPFWNKETLLVNASKGIELESLLPMSDVVTASLELDEEARRRYAVLSGPSFAREVMEEKPTAVVLGCADEQTGARLREAFATPWFRAYSSRDVRGVELGGAVKNIIAIAAGVADGLDFGHNARAALVTRGLAEIARLGSAMQAVPATFMGLSGLGDLMLTCTGDLSRNRQVGLRLGKGESIETITAGMNMVAEGVKTTRAVHQLAGKLHVDMPITESMNRVLDGSLSPLDAVAGLMGRALKEEG